MTTEEAMNGIKNLFSEHELDLPKADSLEVLHIAINAMNKQIPQKILFARNMMTKECCFACPRCNRKVESAHTHCWNCGQKLDWD